MAEFPDVIVYDSSDREEDAALQLSRRLEEAGITSPLVVSSIHGSGLATRLNGIKESEVPGSDADQRWAADLGSRARRAGADAVVAIGGGRCIDVGKLAAVRAGLTVIAVPTQL